MRMCLMASIKLGNWSERKSEVQKTETKVSMADKSIRTLVAEKEKLIERLTNQRQHHIELRDFHDSKVTQLSENLAELE